MLNSLEESRNDRPSPIPRFCMRAVKTGLAVSVCFHSLPLSVHLSVTPLLCQPHVCSYQKDGITSVPGGPKLTFLLILIWKVFEKTSGYSFLGHMLALDQNPWLWLKEDVRRWQSHLDHISSSWVEGRAGRRTGQGWSQHKIDYCCKTNNHKISGKVQ